ICYFSAGTSEDWRPDINQFNTSHMGAHLPLWPGERWLDIRQKEVLKIQKKRIRMAAQKGCDAVDPDNVDGFDNENGGGFKPPLTPKDTIKFMRHLSTYSRRHGMSIGLKNAVSVMPKLEKYVQFAVNEECITEDECEKYDSFMSPKRHRGKPVFHI
ncbi:family 114 glycoside hydrolase, partial [Microthyrium microscopicum]